MMNPTTIKPKNNQKVLINMGNYIDPAIYNSDQDQYYRYPNHADGDRSANYFYSGVIGWWPFPEPVRAEGFVNEPELPFPPAELFTQPLTKAEQDTVDEIYKNRDVRFWGDYPTLPIKKAP